MTSRRLPFGRTLGAIVALAAAVRLVVHAELADYVLARVPLVDAQENVEWAAHLARGLKEAPDVYYKPPLYPHVLSWAMRLCGAQVPTASLLNAVLGLANVVLLALWVRSFATPLHGLAAAAVAAIYGPFLYYEAQALPTTLGVTLALASLCLLAGGVRAPWRWLALGLVLGAAALTRPSFLLWAVAACLWLVASGRLRQALVVAVLTALTILPVTLVNRSRGGAWVLISANGGINFYLGNNPDWQRTWLLRPGLAWEDLVRNVPASARAGQARWDRYFARQAAAWVRAEPVDFARAVVRKAFHFTSGVELDRNLDPRGFRAESAVLRLSPRYVCLAPWLFLGLVLAWRRGSTGRLVVLFWAAGLVSTVFVFASERYRLDAAPAVIAATVLAVAETPALLGRRRAAVRPWLAALLVAASVVLALGDWGRLGDAKGPNAASLEGVAYYAEGDLPRAIAALQRALAADPFDAEAHYQMGTALQRQGRTAQALRAFENAAKLVPGNPKPPMAAGWLLRQRGDREAALAHYERALALDPDNALVHLETAHLLEDMGRVEAARTHYARALQQASDAAVRDDARSGLARLH